LSARERGSAEQAAREKQVGNGPNGGSHGREGGEAAAAWAGFSLVRGGESFSFSFYFLILISIFLYSFLLNS
jgi:hypothetical protein